MASLFDILAVAAFVISLINTATLWMVVRTGATNARSLRRLFELLREHIAFDQVRVVTTDIMEHRRTKHG